MARFDPLAGILTGFGQPENGFRSREAKCSQNKYTEKEMREDKINKKIICNKKNNINK